MLRRWSLTHLIKTRDDAASFLNNPKIRNRLGERNFVGSGFEEVYDLSDAAGAGEGSWRF
ncbi:hypothetical protein JHK84_036271 [Glycine max]|nr:hypothetical protein JHK84_036271 [Glycine max]